MDKLATLLACLPPSDYKNIFTTEVEQLRTTNAEQAEQIERLSTLADKWNLECDEMREDNKRLDGVCQAQAERIKQLEEVLHQSKEALVKNIVGTAGRTPAAHEAIAKINEVLGSE